MTHTPLLASRARRHEPRTGPPRLKSRLRGDASKALAKQQSTGPAGAGPGRPTHVPRRATDAVAPIQSNDSERSPRSAGVRSSAGVPPDGQRHDDCRHGALTTTTRATARSYMFPKSKGRGRARLAAEGLASLQESKGDANGGPGVNFRHPPTLRTENTVHKTAVSSHSAAHSRRVCNMSGAATNHAMVWHNKHYYQESTARLATRKGSKQHGNRNQETTISRQLQYG